MKKFVQAPHLIYEVLKKIQNEDQVKNLGFTCQKKLCECEGYEEFYERLWVWTKVDNDEIYIIVTFDNGNSWCEFVYADIYIKEIVDELKGA